MPSPFPGVDPYLEAFGFWESFHSMFGASLTELLNEGLPPSYVAQSQKRVRLLRPKDRSSERIPDVFVARERGRPPRLAPEPEPAVALLEPTTVPLPDQQIEVVDRWVEVLSVPDLDLVTSIEILSPTNKAGPGRREYLKRRRDLTWGPIHLVELDLLISGRRMPMARDLPEGDALAIVARTDRRPDADVYAWTLRQPLPTIPVPLLHPDPDAMLDLGRAYTLAYDRGGFPRIIEYRRRLPRSLNLGPDERDWAEQLGGGGR